MPRLAAILAFLALVLAAGAPARCGEGEDLLRENRLLRSELDLAKTGKLYAVFDFPRRQVLVKSKGILLRSIPILSVSLWGDPVGIEALPLQSRSALQPPARPQLKPGDANYTPASARPSAEPEALEMNDMPTEYALLLPRGIFVAVRSRAGGSWLRRLWDRVAEALGRPLATLGHVYRRTPYTDIRLVLEAPEAQALYWVLPEGTPILLLDTGR